MGRVTWCAIGLFVGPLAALGIVRAQYQEPSAVNSSVFNQESLSSSVRPERELDYTGTGSCAAVACHGGIARSATSRIRRNELTTWASDDPHATAYQVLLSSRSRQIARNLVGSSKREIPAHEDPRCLACHSTPPPRDLAGETAQLVQDGVGCESCHGQAKLWLGKHTTTEWERLDAAWKSTFGFRETKNLVRRASLCNECHVGQHQSTGARIPIRDVNHDLIAAGHPRLTFELSSYLDNYPRHWDSKDDENSGDYPAKAWLIGQLDTARASLELLRDRAAARTGPWPEFSEYACFSCHHSLRDEAWRRDRPAAGTPTGSPQWGSWPFAVSPRLGNLVDLGPGWKPFVDRLGQLRGEMAHARSDRTEVSKQADQAAKILEACLMRLDSTSLDQEAIDRLIRTFDGDTMWKQVSGWDQATQLYLAIVPLRQARLKLAPDRNEDMQRLKIRLESLLKQLEFPPGLDSPRGFDPSPLLERR